MTTETKTMQAFADAAVAFLNDGLARLSDAHTLAMKARTDAGATVALIARPGINYYSCVVTHGGETVEIFGGYLVVEPAGQPN